MRMIKPEIKFWKTAHYKNRKFETLLARLRIGHTNITHSYRMERPRVPRPECEVCNQPLTVKHLLIECRKYQNERNKWLRNKTLQDVLGETGAFSELHLRNYLIETGLWTKILSADS